MVETLPLVALGGSLVVLACATWLLRRSTPAALLAASRAAAESAKVGAADALAVRTHVERLSALVDSKLSNFDAAWLAQQEALDSILQSIESKRRSVAASVSKMEAAQAARGAVPAVDDPAKAGAELIALDTDTREVRKRKASARQRLRGVA